MLKAIAMFLGFLVLSVNVFAQVNKDLQSELLQMFQEDQKARQSFIASGMKDTSLALKVQEIDNRNTLRLKEIVKQYGWPTKGLVGEDGTSIAFLIVQHADLDLSFQKECLALMTEAELKNSNEVYLPGIAYLTDRIRMADGEKQLYGTQVLINPQTKEVIIYPVEDPDNLNYRRESLGLPKMEEYIELIKKTYNTHK